MHLLQSVVFDTYIRRIISFLFVELLSLIFVFSAPPYKRSRELTINNSLKYSQYTYRRARVSSSAIYTPPPKTNALFKLLFLQIYITALAPPNFRNKKKKSKRNLERDSLNSPLRRFSPSPALHILTRCYEKVRAGVVITQYHT